MGAEKHNFGIPDNGSRREMPIPANLQRQIDETAGVSQILRSRCQAQLALLRYDEQLREKRAKFRAEGNQEALDALPDVEIDVLNPENNPHEVRAAALMDWTADPDNGPASSFDQYVNGDIGPNELSPEDREQLQALLEKIAPNRMLH